MRRDRTGTLLLAALLLLPFGTALGGSRDLVVIHPGGLSPSAEAQTQIGRLMDEIARRAGWSVGSARARYYNRTDEGLAAIQADPPGFLLTTPGFFLAQREALNLQPLSQVLVEGKDSLTYRVVARKGSLTSLDELKGGSLGGAPLAEPDFVERIVLQGKLSFGTEVTVRPGRGLRALRALQRGELDAVVLDPREATALAALPVAAELVTLYESPPIPNTGLMALVGTAVPEDVTALLRATKDFCSAEEGQAICQTYGITGFQPVAPGTYEDLIRRYGTP